MDLSHNASPGTSQDSTGRVHIKLNDIALEDAIAVVGHRRAYRALGMMNYLRVPYKDSKGSEYPVDDGKGVCKNTWRDWFHDYHAILDPLLDAGMILKVKDHNNTSSSVYRVNPIYHGESDLLVTEPQRKHIFRNLVKTSERGMKATTVGFITIPLDDSTIKSLMTENYLKKNKEVLVDEIEKVTKIVHSINITGRIDPRQKRNTRLYSDITSIPKCVTQFLHIDGIPTVSLDQHCTYLTLLPLALKMKLTSIDAEIHSNLIKLQDFIENTPNIHEAITFWCNSNGLDFTKNDVKELLNKWICDENGNMVKKDNRHVIGMFFESLLSKDFIELFDTIKRQKNFSYLLMKLESSIFVHASKTLNKKGIQTLTKHDQIYFTEDNLKEVEKTLNSRFLKLNIINKVKIERSVALTEKTIPLKIEQQNKEQEGQGEGRESRRGGTPCGRFSQLKLQNPVKATKKKRESTVKATKDGRYTIKLNGKQINSRKGESIEQFTERVKKFD